MREGQVDEFAHGVALAGGDHVVVGLGLLEHQPHGFHVFAGVAPIALGLEVPQAQFACSCRPGCGPPRR